MMKIVTEKPLDELLLKYLTKASTMLKCAFTAAGRQDDLQCVNTVCLWLALSTHPSKLYMSQTMSPTIFFGHCVFSLLYIVSRYKRQCFSDE